jgi:hypothetical protein
MTVLPPDYEALTREAVAHYWKTISAQGRSADRGQLDGFCHLLNNLLIANGLPDAHVFSKTKLELPGFFSPTTPWDIVVVYEETLIAALRLKSQQGPSLGSNYHGWTEEAVGMATDLWNAYREQALGATFRPWLGWLTLLEDCEESTRPVEVEEPHFKVLPEFRGTSYAKRYEISLRRLRLEKLFDATVFLMCSEKQGQHGLYTEFAADLAMKPFLASLAGRVGAFSAIH